MLPDSTRALLLRFIIDHRSPSITASIGRGAQPITRGPYAAPLDRSAEDGAAMDRIFGTQPRQSAAVELTAAGGVRASHLATGGSR